MYILYFLDNNITAINLEIYQNLRRINPFQGSIPFLVASSPILPYLPRAAVSCWVPPRDRPTCRMVWHIALLTSWNFNSYLQLRLHFRCDPGAGYYWLMSAAAEQMQRFSGLLCTGWWGSGGSVGCTLSSSLHFLVHCSLKNIHSSVRWQH